MSRSSTKFLLISTVLVQDGIHWLSFVITAMNCHTIMHTSPVGTLIYCTYK